MNQCLEQDPQLLAVVCDSSDAGRGHCLGVLPTVTGNRLVGDHGKASPHRLERGQSSGILDQRVARGHEAGHVVGPSDDDGSHRLVFHQSVQPCAQPTVFPASDDRNEFTLSREGPNRLLGRTYSPGNV